MLEGKELEGKIGSDGGYFVDINEKLVMRLEAAYGKEGAKGGAFVEVDLVAQLEKAAAGNAVAARVLALIKGVLPA